MLELWAKRAVMLWSLVMAPWPQQRANDRSGWSQTMWMSEEDMCGWWNE